MPRWLHELEQAVPGTLTALALSALTAALVLLALGWPGRPVRVRTALGWALGLGGGFAVGSLIIGVPILSTQWKDSQRLLLLLLPAAVLIECVAALPRFPWLLAWTARLVLAAAVARVILHGSSYLVDFDGPGSADWTAAEAVAWLSGLAAALAVVWAALALLAQRAPGPSVPGALALVCAGAGLTILCSHYLTDGALGLVLAAALAGGSAASALLPKPEGSQAAVGVALVALFALLVATRFYADLTTLHAALLLFAPLLCWLPELPGLRRLASWQRGLLRMALVVVPVAFAVVGAYDKNQERQADLEVQVEVGR
jgi:hypothetical protein